ncbi:MAG: cardiolipin synthase [Bacteroidaceae bacterium]|nr:cardiolipin synthase [Bacteroidaceae bacterium]
MKKVFLGFFACLLSHTFVLAQSSDAVVYRWIEKENIPLSHHNRVKLLEDGLHKFPALFQDIREAKHSIHLDYFAMRNDSISNTLFSLLAVKNKQGVEVRALFDAYANLKSAHPLRENHLNALNQLGVEIRPWDKIKFPWVNHVIPRDHRKLAVIDGRIAYAGGMNIADYYIVGADKYGPWCDMQVRIEGDAARDFQDVFLGSWNKETKQHIGGDAYYNRPSVTSGPAVLLSRQDSLMLHLTGTPGEQQAAADEAVRQLKELEGEANDYVAGPMRRVPLPYIQTKEYVADVAVLHRKPYKTPSIMRDFYVTALDAAQEKVYIINPYFTPTHKVNRAIKRALKRGVEVQIMVSTISDVGFTPEIGMRSLNKLRKRGAKVFLFDAGFHHTKIMTVDGKFCTVGSTNLEARSLRYDYEINAVILHPGPTQELIQMFENDKQASHELTDEIWKSRSFKQRLQSSIGSLLIWCI